MIAFSHMLMDAAQQANMRVPEDPENFKKDEYIHFWVFCYVQLGAPCPRPGVHFDNAKVVASFSEENLRTSVTVEDLLLAGFQIGHTSY